MQGSSSQNALLARSQMKSYGHAVLVCSRNMTGCIMISRRILFFATHVCLLYVKVFIMQIKLKFLVSDGCLSNLSIDSALGMHESLSELQRCAISF